jgi:butyrate kinase
MKIQKKSIRTYQILVINPGSTSTKVALFKGNRPAFSRTVEYTDQELSGFTKVHEQLGTREKAVRVFMNDNCITELDAVAGRGGLLKPLHGGTYRVSDAMCRDLEDARYGEHASNLGPILAKRFGVEFCVPAYIVDPVTVDEYEPSSRVSGVPGIERKCRTHALNIRAVSRRCARKMGKALADTTFVVAHLGGGISVCALAGGRIIDSTDALLGEGPFAMERAGTLPLKGVVDLCFDGGSSKEQVLSLLSKRSGFKGYIGTDRLKDVLARIKAGDERSCLIFDAMVRQTVKWIGAMMALVKGKADAVILTGGMVNAHLLSDAICMHIEPMAEVRLYPGEFEMEALAEGALRVLQNIEPVLEY